MEDAALLPTRSPLLMAAGRHQAVHARRANSDNYLSLISSNEDVLEDIDQLDSGSSWKEHREDSDDLDEDEDDIEDFSLEDGHIDGIPSAGMRFDAKRYKSTEFADQLFILLRDNLQILGWSTLPTDLPSSVIHIHKVSGSLTNAVFFVSIPPCDIDVATPLPNSLAALQLQRLTVLDMASDDGRSTPTAERMARGDTVQVEPKTLTVRIEAPTLLLRIYGPSSGSLISRKTELHILHTLSSDYQIGPRVLGTFSNGRVEEYFHSRALHKEEMRDSKVSKSIGRRMRELHTVDLGRMQVPDSPTSGSGSRDSSGGSMMERVNGSAGPTRNNSSSGSLYSTSSGSSIFSFGTSIYSSSSGARSTSSLTTIDGQGELSTTPIFSSPLLLPRRDSTESTSARKKRGRPGYGHRQIKDKLGVWENITRWTREAKLVLKALDELAAMPGFSRSLDKTPSTTDHVLPLTSPSLTLSVRATLNLPLFEQQVKLYRKFVQNWEKTNGKSKRVFSHNDTQYGNLLMMTPREGEDEKELERKAHERIIVVDFEYASANPRGFDLANHFVERQADYHHPTLSHSLISHEPYPEADERAEFLRAYIGCDTEFDETNDHLTLEEDSRVTRLEEEVRIWKPSSHAMWTVWGIVQAKEDLLKRVDVWKADCLRREAARKANGGKEVVEEKRVEEKVEVDFDYLSYSLGRINLFRQELKELGIID